MNKLLIICGFLFLQEGTTQKDEPEPVNFQEVTYVTSIETTIPALENIYTFSFIDTTEKTLDISSIEYIEEEEEVVLGFHPELYVPRGFDPHIAYFDINSIEYIEEEEEIDLGFDPKEYLPENFDPHAFYFDINSIEYIEYDEVDLGFDHKQYLPEGFDPHLPNYNIKSIAYVEEVEIDLGCDSKKYLPKDFYAYQKPSKL